MTQADLHPIDLPDIEELLAAIAAGEAVGFYASDDDRSAPAPFRIRGVVGGFKVTAADGRHIGGFACITAAWTAGVAATRKAVSDLAQAGTAEAVIDGPRDPWGKDFPRTLALIKR